MTAFISHCWRRLWRNPPAHRLVQGLCLAVLCLLLWQPAAYAANVEFRQNELVASEQEYIVNASLNLPPRQRLQELVEGGVALPFKVEFTLARPRWYWFNETLAEQTLDLTLSYHALTRQYRVRVGRLNRNFSSFDEAWRALLSVNNWAVLDRNRVREGETYTASLRFRLDLNTLPKPFQVAALGSKDLDLTTGWVTWNVQPGRDTR